MKACELTDLAVEWLSVEFPQSIIIRELSVADWGGASVDVAAITDTKIVGVEVKGEGDSPSRLDRQGITYGMVVREMWLLPDESLEKKCRQSLPVGWGVLEVRDGLVRPRNKAMKIGERENVTVGDQVHYRYPSIPDDSRYDPCKAYPQLHLCPHSICGTLWRDELYDMARLLGLRLPLRVPVNVITSELCANVPVTVLHDQMVAALRRRSWKKHVIDLRKDTTQ